VAVVETWADGNREEQDCFGLAYMPAEVPQPVVRSEVEHRSQDGLAMVEQHRSASGLALAPQCKSATGLKLHVEKELHLTAKLESMFAFLGWACAMPA